MVWVVMLTIVVSCFFSGARNGCRRECDPGDHCVAGTRLARDPPKSAAAQILVSARIRDCYTTRERRASLTPVSRYGDVGYKAAWREGCTTIATRSIPRHELRTCAGSEMRYALDANLS